MDPTAALAWVSFFIALLAGGGLTLQRTKVRELRADVNDERGRTATAREEVADLKLWRTEAEATITQLKSDLRHAEQLATGEAHWVALDDTLKHHDERALRQIAYVENQVHDVTASVAEVKESVENLAVQFLQIAQKWDPKQ